MARCRKSHLLFFLLILVSMQFIFPPISSPSYYPPLSWSSIDEPDLFGHRVYYGESSGNYVHIIGVRNEAQNITANPSMKATMRTSVTPLVLLSEFLVMTTFTDKIVYLLFVLCYSLCIFSWLIKKHPDI